MQNFLIIVSYFINIGIVFHILKFVSGVGLHFLINDEKGTKESSTLRLEVNQC